jgi:DNA-binding NarL/FixJ family response regulator
MINLDQVKVTPRDQQVLNLLVQGCSNKEIAGQLNISPRTVKAPPYTVFARRNPRGPQTREVGHRYLHEGGSAVMTPCERLTPKEIQISILVWEGLTNREIGKIVGTSEQVIKNHLRSAFDKIGVWSRLELAMYVASHGGRTGLPRPSAPACLMTTPSGPIRAGSRAPCDSHALTCGLYHSLSFQAGAIPSLCL